MIQTVLIRIAMVVALVLGGFLYGNLHGSSNATLKCAGEQASQIATIQGERDAIQEKLNETAKAWAEDQKRSKGAASSTVDRLTESNVRLSVKLADATIAEVQAHNRGLADGRAELHRETAEALIGITQDADRQVKALQDSLKEVTQ